MSYNSGYLSDDWKLAFVVPIHKKGSKSNVGNYRPISLTSLVMKTFEKIIREELFLRCTEHLDNRQHEFLPSKSCCTQMVQLCDSISISLNENIRSDVIYFDFAKAFDSVNHDIILSKLKYQYHIDGLLLKFITNYLKNRKQKVVIGNEISSARDVLSGVPQGSIIGPLLFVLFINDITRGLSPGTNIALYADDTKIWRKIYGEDDHQILQHDISYLLNWAVQNKIVFHPNKCKVLSITHLRPPFLDILPEIQFMYHLGSEMLDYCESEKDLGIIVNSKLNWNEHCDYIISKFHKKMGLLRRTCHFVKNPNRRRVLYITLVRSLFEHCPIVWRPSSTTIMQKLENLQKHALKWILNDFENYTNVLYILKCKFLKIVPIESRFDYHDLTFFQSIFYGHSPVKLPQYLSLFDGTTRLRSTHLDRLCLVSSVSPKFSASRSNTDTEHAPRNFEHSYFYRTHLAWNRLPFQLREIECHTAFKEKLVKHLWNELHQQYFPDDSVEPD